MQREMNCLSQHMDAGQGIDWQDVCYTSASPFAQHQQDVSQALDAYDPSASPAAPQPQAEVASAVSMPESVSESVSPEQRVPLLKQVNNFIHRKVHEVEMGTEISHIVYKEPIFDLKNRGEMYGIYGVYTYRPNKEEIFSNDVITMYRLDAKISFGQMDYSSTSGTISGIEDYLFELRGVMGYDWAISNDWLATPYFGFGYRRLSDDSSGKTSSLGASGYGRVANYVYIPIGLEISHQLNKAWRVGATGEFDWFLWGRQESFLSDADSSLPDLINEQKRGLGLRGSLKVLKEGDKVNFLVEPFVRYWHLSDSKTVVAAGSGVVIAGLEPNNNSTEMGIKAGVQF